jgi:hypothetical protein
MAEGTFTHLEVTGKLGGEGLGEISDGRVEVEDSGVLNGRVIKWPPQLPKSYVLAPFVS